jgi:hypothetical protein
MLPLIILIPLQLFAASDPPVKSESFPPVTMTDSQFSSFASGVETVGWGKLINELSTEQNHSGLTSGSSDFDDSGFAFSSQSMDKFFIDTLQTQNLSSAARLSGTGFRFSDDVLQQLREVGVPEDIVQQLTLLGDQGFSQEALFWEAFEDHFGQEQTQQYRQLTLEHIGGNGPSDGLVAQTTPWYPTEQSLDNLEAWNDFLYYPRIARQALAYQSQRDARRRSIDLLEEDDDLFDVFGFFRRLGIPKPSAIIILALGLYILLALLARR